jgi:hypothetical protein
VVLQEAQDQVAHLDQAVQVEVQVLQVQAEVQERVVLQVLAL